MKAQPSIKKVLIYRLGSLGDTVIILPCLHLIARVFPQAERKVLTNHPINSKAAPMEAILEGSGLVHGYFAYPLRSRDLRRLLDLRAALSSWEPEVLIYLAAPRGFLKAVRDALFFRWCGIKTLVGIPYSRELQHPRWLAEARHYEPEASRLARCLASLGDPHVDDPTSWDLGLTPAEERTATGFLKNWSGRERYIACSVGTKVDVNDWGEANWRDVLGELAAMFPDYGVVFVGAIDDLERSERVAKGWTGPKLNLCGRLTPRESAVVLRGAVFFIGHDSGPMHLAAAVGTPCVAIFSARKKPKVWFPYGQQHKVIYHQTDCYGCELEVCERFRKKCIASITVREVLQAIEHLSSEGASKTNVVRMHTAEETQRISRTC